MDILTSLYGFGFCLEIFAITALILFLINSINRMRRDQETQYRKRTRKFGRDALLLLVSLILFFAGIAFINFALFIQAYRTYAIGEPIVKVTISARSSDQEFSVRINELGKPVTKDNAPMDETFRIKGDRWMLEGHIIRFQPWLSFIGLKPIYQLTRIQGSYYSIDEERNSERTVYALVDSSDEEWWKWMYQKSESIPFMDMAYGSAISQDAQKGSQYIVTVLPSGFSLQKSDRD
jgi:Na+-transporting methylmalonyl-CoA/oxaloacetate decarboxylase gamma subunit